VSGSIFKLLLTIYLSFNCLGAAQPSAQVAPYLLPQDHPIKPLLDVLFSSSRATFNLETLEKAGFSKTSPRKFTKLIVTRHPAIPGYVFKLYLDAQRFHKDLAEHHFWILRVQGSELVRSIIAAHGLESSFKVPYKWIYPLPKHPKPSKNYYPKHYILVEEDMYLLKDSDNKALWASSYVSQPLLQALYLILKQAGLYDCAKPDNIPFSVDGRIAFIDTQTHSHTNVDYNKLTPYLSPANQAYWKSLDE